ncbi:MAG: hypothetical protein UX94_C0005G0067 [Parcubacteria group bacterium GW2011_GWA2_47_21]|nr:MAG: hypothetical protein UX94_C0005G0067 [Parcubacteria group bacterium GW2011_GWA2_47_21]
MSPLNKKTIHEKLFKLQESVKILEELRAEGRNPFFTDRKNQDVALLNMFVSIELITDIGNHIITEVFQKQAKNYKEIIELLGKTGVITEIFAKENEDMTKFRNLIAHDYEKITPEGIYENLQKAPDVFREFAKYFVEFMDKQPSKD